MNLYELTKKLEQEAEATGKKPYEIMTNVTEVEAVNGRIYITAVGNF